MRQGTDLRPYLHHSGSLSRQVRGTSRVHSDIFRILRWAPFIGLSRCPSLRVTIDERPRAHRQNAFGVGLEGRQNAVPANFKEAHLLHKRAKVDGSLTAPRPQHVFRSFSALCRGDLPIKSLSCGGEGSVCSVWGPARVPTPAPRNSAHSRAVLRSTCLLFRD